jgi:nitrogen-specific signal transduction histidine kinase
VGEGTGLGLDTVQRIVKKHRGTIQVTSKPGDTLFQVWLPLSESPAENLK